MHSRAHDGCLAYPAHVSCVGCTRPQKSTLLICKAVQCAYERSKQCGASGQKKVGRHVNRWPNVLWSSLQSLTSRWCVIAAALINMMYVKTAGEVDMETCKNKWQQIQDSYIPALYFCPKSSLLFGNIQISCWRVFVLFFSFKWETHLPDQPQPGSTHQGNWDMHNV